MDKILEMIRTLGVATDKVVSDLIVKLALGEDQIRALEPVAKILQADTAAAEKAVTDAVTATKQTAQTEIDRLAGELKGATDKIEAFETSRKNAAVDRLYETQVKLGVYKAAEYDSEEKVKALKEDLAKQPTDSLEFSLRNLERLQGMTQTDSDHSSAVPKRTGTPAAPQTDNDKTPRFLKLRG